MGWVVSTTPRPLYPSGSPGTHCTGGRVGPRAGLDGCGKSLPHRDSIPDRPAHSESLYRLSYRGPYLNHIILYNQGFHTPEIKKNKNCSSVFVGSPSMNPTAPRNTVSESLPGSTLPLVGTPTMV